jgi:hypothetical protein
MYKLRFSVKVAYDLRYIGYCFIAATKLTEVVGHIGPTGIHPNDLNIRYVVDSCDYLYITLKGTNEY